MTDKRKQELEEEIAYFRQQFEPINQQIQLPHSLTAEALLYRLQNEPAPAKVRRPQWQWKLASAVVCLLLVVLALPLSRSLGLGNQLVPQDSAQMPMAASMESAPEEAAPAEGGEMTKTMPQSSEAMPESAPEEEVLVEEDAGAAEEVVDEEPKARPNTAMMEAPRSASGSSTLAAFASQEELMKQVNALLPQDRAQSSDEVVVEESADALPEAVITEEAVPEEVIMEEEPVEEAADPRPLLGATAPQENASQAPALSVGMSLSTGEQASIQEGVLSLDEQGTVSWKSTAGQQSWQLESSAIQVTCVAADQFVLVGQPYEDSAWGTVTQVQWYRMDAGEATLLVTLEQQGSFSQLACTEEGGALLVTSQSLSRENAEQLLPHYRIGGESVTLPAQQISYAAGSVVAPRYLVAVHLDASGVRDAQAVLGALDMTWQSGQLVVSLFDGSQQTLSVK